MSSVTISRRDVGTIVVLASALLAAASAVFPWLTGNYMGAVNGIDGLGVREASPIANGAVTILCAGAAALIATLASRRAAPSFVLGNLGGLVAFIGGWFVLAPNFALRGSIDGAVLTPPVTVGVGPYLTVLGGIGILAGSLIRYAARESTPAGELDGGRGTVRRNQG